MEKKQPLAIVYNYNTATYHVFTHENEEIYSNWSLSSCELFCHKLKMEATTMKMKQPLAIIYDEYTVTYHVFTPENKEVYSNWSLSSCELFCHKLNREYTITL